MRFLFRCLSTWLRILLTFRRKVVYIGGTCNVNLGDNAQRMLIARWCRDNYPKHAYIEIPIDVTCCRVAGFEGYMTVSILSAALFLALRICQKKGDLFVTGSGYGLIDHAPTWLAYARLAVSCKRTPILMMPQTINFQNAVLGYYASCAFNGHGRLLMLCRDYISLEKAKKLFWKCHPIPYPDIVTSMIGTRASANKREGVLFCIRDDWEAFYSHEQIRDLESRFTCRVEHRDTQADIDPAGMNARRAELIDEFLEYVSHFKVVITDRYHGTIFSLVANTPVVVISSNDHKISSGVKWFPDDIFGRYIQYADTLDRAYEIANTYLARTEFPTLPTYFRDKYWNRLVDTVKETL